MIYTNTTTLAYQAYILAYATTMFLCDDDAWPSSLKIVPYATVINSIEATLEMSVTGGLMAEVVLWVC